MTTVSLFFLSLFLLSLSAEKTFFSSAMVMVIVSRLFTSAEIERPMTFLSLLFGR